MNRDPGHRPPTGLGALAVRSALRVLRPRASSGPRGRALPRALAALAATASAATAVAVAVGLAAHPEFAAALSAMTTVYIAVISTRHLWEDRSASTPPAPAPEHPTSARGQLAPPEDAPSPRDTSTCDVGREPTDHFDMRATMISETAARNAARPDGPEFPRLADPGRPPHEARRPHKSGS
ncbi:hypothetical protein [Actinomadura fibrosa]|uniref:Uncharacterized protein n=1 Tax=Actinomadura fibrosa TaxID=111802 RepID=A0ABW2XQW6_9ACTN|nr:hypothetical protein [Actinomadura fibrosa]